MSAQLKEAGATAEMKWAGFPSSAQRVVDRLVVVVGILARGTVADEDFDYVVTDRRLVDTATPRERGCGAPVLDLDEGPTRCHHPELVVGRAAAGDGRCPRDRRVARPRARQVRRQRYDTAARQGERHVQVGDECGAGAVGPDLH